jgi:hypothetical protein
MLKLGNFKIMSNATSDVCAKMKTSHPHLVRKRKGEDCMFFLDRSLI